MELRLRKAATVSLFIILMILGFIKISYPAPDNSELIEKNYFEFGKEGVIAFCALKIGDGLYLTAKHAACFAETALSKINFNIIKSSLDDLALLSNTKKHKMNSIKIAEKVILGETVWLIDQGKWTKVEVVHLFPMIIYFSSCRPGNSGKPVFNGKGELAGIIDNQRKAKGLIGAQCVSPATIRAFLSTFW